MEEIEKSIWYFVCSVEGRGAIHVEHDFVNRNEAEQRAADLFENGKTFDDGTVQFDQVVCISDKHEICFHTTKMSSK